MATASRPAILALDLGTSVLKAGLIGLDGEVLAAARGDYPTVEDAGRSEQDPEAWWAAVVRATRELVDGRAAARSESRAVEAQPGERPVGVGPVEVVAIVADGQGPTCVATRSDGTPARPAIGWSDRRSVAERDELAAASGLPGWLLGILPAALWIERNEPAVASASVSYLAAWEWVALRLSGVAAATATHGQVVPEAGVAAGLGLPPERIPAAVRAGSILGGLAAPAADALGLPAGVPVIAGLNDAYASCLGAGLLDAGDALDTGGSSGGLVVYADREPDVPGAWIAPAPLEGRWLVGGAMAATGRALDWLRDDILAGAASTEELLAAAAATPPGAEGLVFLPYLSGERSPIWDASARGVFAGLTLRHERGHLARAVLEGAAFALRHVAEPIVERGYGMSRLRVCGGPARSADWNRIKADVLGVAVEVPAVTDTAMLGAAVLGATAIGAAADVPAAVRSMVRVDARLEPDPAAAATYEVLYAVYRDLYPALRPVMHALAEFEAERT